MFLANTFCQFIKCKIIECYTTMIKLIKAIIKNFKQVVYK